MRLFRKLVGNCNIVDVEGLGQLVGRPIVEIEFRDTAEEAAPEETTASTENTDGAEVPESDEKTTSTTTGNTAAAAAATAVVISGYAVAMTRKKNK